MIMYKSRYITIHREYILNTFKDENLFIEFMEKLSRALTISMEWQSNEEYYELYFITHEEKKDD